MVEILQEFNLSPEILEKYRALRYDPDAQVRSVPLSMERLRWTDEDPEGWMHLVAGDRDSYESITNLFVLRNYYWVERTIPEEWKPFWQSAQTHIPEWPGFKRLDIPDEEFQKLNDAVVANSNIMMLGMMFEADEFDMKDEGRGVTEWEGLSSLGSLSKPHQSLPHGTRTSQRDLGIGAALLFVYTLIVWNVVWYTRDRFDIVDRLLRVDNTWAYTSGALIVFGILVYAYYVSKSLRGNYLNATLLKCIDGKSLGSRAHITVVQGDLLDQEVDAIVNAWNRNIIPWWLLLPHGVSGAIKKRAGLVPLKELGKKGPIPLGGAVLTGAGKLPYKGIIHVAGISMLWISSEKSVRLSTRNALDLAEENGFESIAFPLIGAGTGGAKAALVLLWMVDEIRRRGFDGEVCIVKYRESA